MSGEMSAGVLHWLRFVRDRPKDVIDDHHGWVPYGPGLKGGLYDVGLVERRPIGSCPICGEAGGLFQYYITLSGEKVLNDSERGLSADAG